jgi:oligoendopeptidase F
MEKLFEKLKEYLHMDTEIPYEEFSEYYKSLIEELNKSFEDMDQETRVKARYICSIVQANAESRGQRSKVNAKAYKKINAKCSFLMDAINFRLLKDGMTQAEIDKLIEEINESI